MKAFVKSVILCAAVIFAVPAAAGGLKADKSEDIPVSVTAMPQSHTIKLLCSATGGITETDIEDYAVYAVLEEVPFIPDTEALKAQVCAARTYAARRILAGESENGAHISDDSSKYQTALTESAAMAVYGDGYDEAVSAVKAAAKATDNNVRRRTCGSGFPRFLRRGHGIGGKRLGNGLSVPCKCLLRLHRGTARIYRSGAICKDILGISRGG